jgi:hypothetical protein
MACDFNRTHATRLVSVCAGAAVCRNLVLPFQNTMNTSAICQICGDPIEAPDGRSVCDSCIKQIADKIAPSMAWRVAWELVWRMASVVIVILALYWALEKITHLIWL